MGKREEKVLKELERIKKGGSLKGHEKQEQANKLFVRDRLKLFFDDKEPYTEIGSFARNWDPKLPADGVVTGSGRIDGRTILFTANDFTVKAGSIGKYHGEKLIRTQEAAIRARKPILYLVDSSGGRIDEAAGHHADKESGGKLFYLHSIMSGSIPQIGVLYGSCFAGTAYTPVFCDLLIMMKDSAMAIASPRMVEMVIGQRISAQELGGVDIHTKVSGSAHFVADTEKEASEIVKKVLSYLPDNCDKKPPKGKPKDPNKNPDEIDDIIPMEPNKPYDIHKLIEAIVDGDSFLETKKLYAAELVTGFARLNGNVAGVVANNPAVKGGAIFPDSSDKGAEFVWFCDAFNIPLLYLVDTPGFMVGKTAEKNAILRKGKKFIFATSSATVPKISVIVRKAYGAGIYAMSGPAYDPDVTLALPSAEIAIMGPEAAINAVYYNKIMAISDPKEREITVKNLRTAYRESYDIFKLAGEMTVDQVIPPKNLRSELIKYFETYSEKEIFLPKRKHGTII